MAEYREGQTATNPKTGQKIVFKGGQWVSAENQDKSKFLSNGDAKLVSEARDASDNATNVLGDLTRFQDLNARTGTGGINNVFGITELRKAFDPSVQQMEEIKARLAPGQRPAGSGSSSDSDLALYLQAVPNVRSGKKANDAIIERGRAEAVRRQQYADFLDKYARENGTLNGAPAAFRGVVGLGTRENPYSVEGAGDRTQLPRGAYYQSPAGLRRNDNGPRGNPVVNAFATAPQAKAGGGGPKPGAVEDGYRFKGGNPADQSNWERVR